MTATTTTPKPTKTHAEMLAECAAIDAGVAKAEALHNERLYGNPNGSTFN